MLYIVFLLPNLHHYNQTDINYNITLYYMKIHPAIQEFDPSTIGFRCGLEVHQQLLTDEKLFCHCPVLPYSDKYDTVVMRHMRPTLSELGEYDGTALMEFKTKKKIFYRINKDTVCTYEMDDNPPFRLNQQAVDITVEIALLFNCSIIDEIHIIRKQYLDGSIPAGFQRSAIIGLNGWMPVGGRKIGIRQISVEEDACREFSDIGHDRICWADRLSIPLVEVVTEPDILKPEDGFIIGNEIGRLLRSTRKIRRGIGSVRQDVNVSIEGGTRIEIKGVPRLQLIPRLVHYEAYRQHRLLGLKEMLQGRKITEQDLVAEQFDMTGVLKDVIPSETENSEDGSSTDIKIGAIILKGMKGLLDHPIGPYRTFADDISGRLKVVACLDHYPMLLHSDCENGISERDRDNLSINCNFNVLDDCAVVVWGDHADVDTALNEIDLRVREATVGIPGETRQVLSNGETGFERILPGPNRMYPDTDLPTTVISADQVKLIKETLPELPWIRESRYLEMGLSHHLAYWLTQSSRANLFDHLVEQNYCSSTLTASVLIDLLKHYRRRGGNLDQLTDDNLEKLFIHYQSGSFAKEGFRLLLEASARTGETDWDLLLEQLVMEYVDDEDAVNTIIWEVMNSMERVPRDESAQFRYIFGEVMAQLRGKYDGVKLADMTREIIAVAKNSDNSQTRISLWLNK
jgi:glutamyl-tRNA(Gln) amidotransferase subunit E